MPARRRAALSRMKKPKHRFLLVILLILPCFSGAETPGDGAVSGEQIHKRPLMAGTETLLVNGFFMGLTSYVLNFPWARPTAESIRNNFTQPWQWEETDGFKVNQIGHPYQGALYFTAGRANGFNFYESFLFSALGSFAWEAFGEKQRGSINDMISTTIGAGAIGEMLHLLYLEAYAAGVPAPLAALISPLDGINRLITGKNMETGGGNIYDFSVHAGAGYARVRAVENPGGEDLFSFRGPAGGVGIDVIYGNPFEQHSVVPHKHFELKTMLDMDPGNYFDLRLISDAYLFSFSPVNTETDTMSTGLSLHFDCVSLGKFDMYDSTIDQYSNALDWSLKYQHLFGTHFVFQTKLHGGFTFFGVSEYYSPEAEKRSLKNYGAGTNVKLSFDLDHQKWGLLSASLYHYYLWSFPGIVPFSSGQVFWLFADVSYSYRFTDHLSLGISDHVSLEKAWFDGFPDTEKYANTIKTFVRWTF